MTTFAVTGATGSFGRLALAHLAATIPAAQIVAIARNAEKAADLVAAGYDVRIASYGDAAALETALTGVDRVLLVSGSEVGKRAAQHASVIDAARSTGVSRIVYTSAPHADNTTLILAPEHAATEALLAESGIEYVAVRNNWYTENYAQNVAVARNTGVLLAAAGEGRVASATRSDFAEGAVAVLTAETAPERVLEFTGTTSWNFHDLAAAIAEVIGSPVEYRAVSAEDLVVALGEAGLDAGTAGFVAALDTNIAEGTLADVYPTLTELLGRPTTGLVEGLRAATA